MSIRICLIKTLLWKKKSHWRKKSTISDMSASLKKVTRKIEWDKTMVKEKWLQDTFISPPNQTIIPETMKINLLYQLLKNYVWEWLCEQGLQDYYTNKFVDCFYLHTSKDHLFQLSNAYDIIFINDCFILSSKRQTASNQTHSRLSIDCWKSCCIIRTTFELSWLCPWSV